MAIKMVSKSSTLFSFFIVIISLGVLIYSSNQFVIYASKSARLIGISESIIGLTIVAIGTSMPELVSSIVASVKGQNEMVLGNIIGSNIFNISMVTGSSGLVQPLSVQREVLIRDFPVLIAFTIVLFLFGYGFKSKRGRINRIEGALLLSGYVLYTYLII